MNSSSTPSLLPFGPKPTADASATGKVSFAGTRGDAALLAGFGPAPEGLLFEGLVPLQPVSADAKAVAAAILAPATTEGEGATEAPSATAGDLATFLGSSAGGSRRIRGLETPSTAPLPGQPATESVPPVLASPIPGEPVVTTEGEPETGDEVPELPQRPSAANEDRKARPTRDGATGAMVTAGPAAPAAPAVTPVDAPAGDQAEMAPEQRINASAPTRQPAGRVIAAPAASVAAAAPAAPAENASVGRAIAPSATPARTASETVPTAEVKVPAATSARTVGTNGIAVPVPARDPSRVARDVAPLMERAERPAGNPLPAVSPASTAAVAESAQIGSAPSPVPVAASDARPAAPVSISQTGTPAPAVATPAPTSSAVAQAAATGVPAPEAKPAGVAPAPVATPGVPAAAPLAGGSTGTVTPQAVPTVPASVQEADPAGRSPRTADVAGLVDDTPAVALPQQVSGWKKILLNAYRQHVKCDAETVGIKDAKADGIMPTLLTTPFTPVESAAPTAPVAPTPSSIPAEWAEKLAQLTARADRLAPARLEVSLPMQGGEDLRVRVSCRGGHISCEFQNASSELQRLFLREWPGLSQLFGRENAQLRVEQPSFVNLTDPQDRPGGDQSNRRQRDEHAAREEDEAIAAFFATQRKPAGRAA